VSSNILTDFSQSYGPDNYTAFTCYDFVQTGQPSTLVEYGTYASTSSSSPTNIAISSGKTSLSYAYTSGVSPIQAGALLSFNSSTITARFGISLISSAQACSNAEEEVPDWSWDRVQEASRSKWEELLSRIIVDTDREDANVVKLLYSSVILPLYREMAADRALQLYRVSLVPANATNENPYWKSPYPFFDALFWYVVI